MIKRSGSPNNFKSESIQVIKNSMTRDEYQGYLRGNIMKYTEGAFRDWGYQLAQEEFADQVIAESDLWEQYNGEIPERSVVIPGSYEKKFNAGKFFVPCALIIGNRKKSTDKKTTLNQVLREFKIST